MPFPFAEKSLVSKISWQGEKAFENLHVLFKCDLTRFSSIAVASYKPFENSGGSNKASTNSVASQSNDRNGVASGLCDIKQVVQEYLVLVPSE